MDNFIAFLVGGLIIIMILLFFTSSFGINLPEQCSGGTCSVNIEEHNIENTSTIFLVGSEDVEVFQTYKFNNINISHVKINKDDVVGGRTLFNGVLFGSQDMKITMDAPDSLQRIYMTFRVDNTNEYGTLKIKVNGNVIDNKIYSVGNYIMEMPVLDHYNIEIVPSSSGWRFWSPTVYVLKNIKIHTESFSMVKNRYEFEIDADTYKSLTKGEVFVNMNDFQGNIKVLLNGKMILNKNMTRSVASAVFDKQLFELGKNSVVFEAGENALFAGTADIHAYHIRNRNFAYETEFNISEDAYKNFRGRLSFDVPDILAYGGLSVRIFNNGELYYSKYDNLEEKTYIYPLTKGDIGEGVNRIKIEAVQGAAFHLTNIKLEELSAWE